MKLRKPKFAGDNVRQTLALCLTALCVTEACAIAGCHAGQANERVAPAAVTFVGWGPGSSTELNTANQLLAEFSKRSGIGVNYILGPESADKRFQLYKDWLDKKASTPDVFYTDVIWPGLLSDHMIDLRPYLGKEVEDLWPAAVQNYVLAGELKALPYNLEMGVLYYRTDLLQKYGYNKPPGTWDELEKMAAKIQAGERAAGKPNFWGFVWQGAAYEGLTCNALEWQASYGGGRIVEDNRIVSVNNPQTIKALKMAKRWIGTISPPSVTSFLEEDSRNIWDSGNAAFRRDWVWRGTPAGKLLARSLQGMFSVAPLPSGGVRGAAVVGGQGLAVSKYSAHPREASELVRYLTSRDVQLELWQHDSMLPALREFYQNSKYLAQRPELERMSALLTGGAIPRPSSVTGSKYPEVSRAYFGAVHSILAGNVTAEKGLADLETDLVRITGWPAGKPN